MKKKDNNTDFTTFPYPSCIFKHVLSNLKKEEIPNKVYLVPNKKKTLMNIIEILKRVIHTQKGIYCIMK